MDLGSWSTTGNTAKENLLCRTGGFVLLVLSWFADMIVVGLGFPHVRRRVTRYEEKHTGLIALVVLPAAPCLLRLAVSVLC
jgi:hypothetical protein